MIAKVAKDGNETGNTKGPGRGLEFSVSALQRFRDYLLSAIRLAGVQKLRCLIG
jgi:hypothetical protein